MPAYNFQLQFVSPILKGLKPHTIRRKRKHRPTVPGDMLMMFINMRTPRCHRFAESRCIRVDPLIIYPWRREVLAADHRGVYSWMRPLEIEELAKRDGFVNSDPFFHFFERYGEECLDDFENLWWDPKLLTAFDEVPNE